MELNNLALPPPPPPSLSPSPPLCSVYPIHPSLSRAGELCLSRAVGQVPIETACFKGAMLLLVRPPRETDDPYYHPRIFRGKRRRFEIQIQGRFTRPDAGILYAGGEIGLRQMALGLLLRGVARGLLGLISQVLPIHYSFGSRSGDEAPHIVSPLWAAADRMIVSADGETPPELGSVAALDSEPAEQRKLRRLEAYSATFDPTCTYTFSFNTSNVDLPTWRLCGVPLFGDYDL